MAQKKGWLILFKEALPEGCAYLGRATHAHRPTGHAHLGAGPTATAAPCWSLDGNGRSGACSVWVGACPGLTENQRDRETQNGRAAEITMIGSAVRCYAVLHIYVRSWGPKSNEESCVFCAAQVSQHSAPGVVWRLDTLVTLLGWKRSEAAPAAKKSNMRRENGTRSTN